jgi:hypothetical protein
MNALLSEIVSGLYCSFQQANADRFAANVRPVIEQIKASESPGLGLDSTAVQCSEIVAQSSVSGQGGASDFTSNTVGSVAAALYLRK